MPISYEYVSWNRFYALCGRLYREISKSGYRPDLIIAIARGGYTVGRVLADFFDLMDLVGLKVEHYRGPEKMPHAMVRYPLTANVVDRKILLVDDVSDSGDSFAAALEHIVGQGKPADLRTAALHHKQTSFFVPDFFAHRVVKWRWITYPWAIVEDLCAAVERSGWAPDKSEALRAFVRDEVGMQLPNQTLEQIAPIVLERLAERASKSKP